MRVVDADLNTNPAVVEFAQVDLLGPALGDRAQVVLREVGADNSTFVGSVVTAFAIGISGDGTLTTGGGADITAHYFDQLPTSGGTATKEAASNVIDLFGDADGNGLVQAYNASESSPMSSSHSWPAAIPSPPRAAAKSCAFTGRTAKRSAVCRW